MAAIHAGLLQPGQTKAVGVTILGPQTAFAGSHRNNITSGDWSTFPGAFRFKTGRAATATGGRARNAQPPENAPGLNPGFFVQPAFVR